MTDAQLIQLWNLLFPDNDSREISEQDLRDGLIAFLNTLSTRIGDLPSLNTDVKTSLVAAVNELVSRLENLEDRFAPQFGIADPNDVPPPNNFDYGSVYIQQQNIGGNIHDIGFWIYTNVQNVGWLNLSQTVSAVLFTPQTLSLSEKTQALKNLGYIEIEGNLFEYKRNPNNNTIGFIPGDIALNGWITSTNFGRLLVYVSGDATNITSWNVLDNIEF